MKIIDIMRVRAVIPVLVVEDPAYALPIAQALVEGGLWVIEVTLRTPAAGEVIQEMRKVPGAVVGAGTVVDRASLSVAVAAGAQFLVSPGLTEDLGKAALETGIPFLPGVATAGDLMRGLSLGLSEFKFFPAETSGGIPALKALAGPFNQVSFCPTGGITLATAPDWLAIDPVLCVGGSWIVPKGPPDLAAIGAAAYDASQLRKG
ncbi:MAG: bifunctional 4-hydroxy-2-oxoglutarate aldolase/2-dehydro-3-deoxy-phosphogluconate aldolase [Alphaproteobacteria bacterium]|nr:bifunctional 4-hydroxy-2-oxoglutarate aldolase/2-dehydro-3-deoxy-phosphogluconate aldolase [Alphaproteobacteria bacterium]MBV9370124.1 bifunctional 4-hydroxy-2-oxoglutarate aldolase/2-dehydro-3-deoxy-phosphogluconate aldolase [Alphaproteobacteria bacterium]MBV9901464.1 bifunctional 4-hydroxy-2-oxoglutarate aldolase/2-dehydro-3-deoxy-phosphogluconate aldolase [Alphaproteobacteria bacterium]